jgi:hypothetical protein
VTARNSNIEQQLRASDVRAKDKRSRTYRKAAKASSVKHKAANTATLTLDIAPSVAPIRDVDNDDMD